MSNAKFEMSGEELVCHSMTKANQHKYDLEERTAKFGEDIIAFAERVAQNPINNPLISQIVRSDTSVGANYMEADGASTKKDFRYKISLCRKETKETKETKHWLRMIAKADPSQVEASRMLWQEAEELTRIFSAILQRATSKR